MVLSHLLEFAAFSILYYGQLTTINGHYPEATQSEHIYVNRYKYQDDDCESADYSSVRVYSRIFQILTEEVLYSLDLLMQFPCLFHPSPVAVLH
jgi:hypothetical protein